MSKLKHQETGLQEKIRGWFRDPTPKLKNLRGTFLRADMYNGTQKLAHAAIVATLQKYALFLDAADPAEEWAKAVAYNNFGYTKRQTSKSTYESKDNNPAFSNLSYSWNDPALGGF
jgi:hypothetical protein